MLAINLHRRISVDMIPEDTLYPNYLFSFEILFTVPQMTTINERRIIFKGKVIEADILFRIIENKIHFVMIFSLSNSQLANSRSPR